MKRILVPTDFSECANHAVDAAIQLAQKLKAEVHFLHFLSIPMTWMHLDIDAAGMYPDVKIEIENAKNELNMLERKAREKGVKTRQFLDYSESQSHVVNYIDENKVSLVVMGSHGASGIRELFIGTNAQKVVRMSPVPVLIIKGPFDFDLQNRVVFVSDFEPEVLPSFENIIRFATATKSKIHLIYVNTPSYFCDSWEIKKKMETFKFYGHHRVEACEIIDSYVYEEGLEKYCQDIGGGIVTMATHGRKGISRLVYGSLTEKVVNHLSLPVMSCKIHDTHGVGEHAIAQHH